MSPQDQIAEMFMKSKGYFYPKPRDITKVEGIPCWYYLYKLHDGTLELEVSWNGREWNTLVTSFSVAG